MSILPEYILQTIIIRGIRAIKKDLKQVDTLFRNLDQNGLNDLKTFLTNNAIDLCLNYPTSPPKLPAIIILLKSDSENTAYLADSMGLEVPEQFSYEDVLGGGSITTDLGTHKLIEFGPYPVTSSTNNTLNIDSNLWAIDKYVGKDLTVDIVSGLGAGQSRSIIANGQKTLMISGTWATNPDNTSVFEIHKKTDEVLGEPSSVFNKSNSPKIERRGYLSQAQYQLQVVGSNPAQAIYLATILKSIFLVFKIFMESQGIINFKITSSDFSIKTDYLPDLAYVRSLILDFLYPFDIYEELVNIASSTRGAIEATSLEDGLIKVVSDSVADIPAFGNITL